MAENAEKKDQVAVLIHEYDGIQEYDNPMPGWWSAMFIASIVWAVVYFVGISFGMLPDYGDNLRAELAVQDALKAKALAAMPPLSVEDMIATATSPENLERGATVYKMNCAVCHGNAGEGLIGPNLTDNAWIVGGGDAASIHQVIEKGTTRGMPAWGPILSPSDQVAVTGFVVSLIGTNPPNAKPPEGEVVGGEAPAAAEDVAGEDEEDG